MERQDYFLLPGLFLSVWLRAEHAMHVVDFTVVTRRATEAEPSSRSSSRPPLSDCGGRGKGLEYAPSKEKCCHGQESGAEY